MVVFGPLAVRTSPPTAVLLAFEFGCSWEVGGSRGLLLNAKGDQFAIDRQGQAGVRCPCKVSLRFCYGNERAQYPQTPFDGVRTLS